jgi:ketosteroid isomerase-like protein
LLTQLQRISSGQPGSQDDSPGSEQTCRIRSLAMTSLRTVSLTCFIAILGAGACQAEDNKLRSILEGRYAAMKSAMANRDAKQVAALLAPDFVSVDVSGSEKGAAQMVESLKAAPADPDKVSNTTLLSVESGGGKAVVKQRYDMKTVKAAPDGAKHQIELTTLSTDQWVSVSGTWLIQRTATDQMDYLVDGKPLIHKVRKSEP